MGSDASTIQGIDRRLREKFGLPPKRFRAVKFKYQTERARNKAARTLEREGFAVKKVKKREIIFQRRVGA
jgi:hypothetical protein